MISVEVDLHPVGDSTRKRTLARVVIWNDLSGTPTFGNYRYVVSHQTSMRALPSARELVDDPSLGWKHGAVHNFHRQSGAVKLLAAVLKAARL